MEDIRLNFFKRFVFPLLEPVFSFFSAYGIESTTVIGVPAVLIVILSLKNVEKRSYDYYLRIIAIFLIINTIAIYQ